MEDFSMQTQPIQYGKVFEMQDTGTGLDGRVYVCFNGGLILLSHAVERAQELGRPCFVMLDDKPALIKNFGPAWFERATMTDVRRIAVY
jgi:hypothetical protein